MSVGNLVTKATLDFKSAEAILELRKAFDKIAAVASFLAYHPRPADQDDPLLTLFPNETAYTAAEAYALRKVIEDLNYAGNNLTTSFAESRQITGLE